ncbi:MAG: aminotransferase class V-fold PLP-dependent enzyme [Spirosomataceae bacterium]
MNKRRFLKTVLGSLTLPAINWESALAKVSHLSPTELAENEPFWTDIRKGYRLKPDYINLENGYYCFQTTEVLDQFVNHVRDINYQGSYYMRTVQFENKLKVQQQLAKQLGCTAEEVIVTRNTTESLDTVIAGYDWKAGDEAVMAQQDYGAMLDMFKHQARRYGIVNKMISIPNHPASDEEIVELYEKAITPRTRLLMVCHMVNITGHILPVRKIADMAHRHGVDVMVDGAHAFAHINFNINDLHCDYYGSSLHKWLGTPLGAGLLYVTKGKAKNIWAIYGDMGYADDDIRKLNHTGTHPCHTDLTILDSLKVLNTIGIERKEARLRYLQHYWSDQVRQVPNIVVNTPADTARSCGIANVGIATLKPGDLAKTLLDTYKIWTVAIDYANVRGVRVTPNVYTTTQELDTFVKALKELAAN